MISLKIRKDKLAPVGANVNKSFVTLGVILGAFGGESFFTYLLKLSTHLLDENFEGTVEFKDLTESSFACAVIAALVLLGIIMMNYIQSSRYKGSNPKYTWKRLPQWWELHVRCLAVPVIGLLALAAEVMLLCGLYYLAYRWALPKWQFPQNFDGAFIDGLKWGFM